MSSTKISYQAKGFSPSLGRLLKGNHDLRISWKDLVWAGVTTGKPGIAYLLAHGWHSISDILARSHSVYANLQQNQARFQRSDLYGYFREPELSASVFDAQGYFHTGDMGLMDEAGRVTFRNRIKDMLKVGGENVAAVEVEDYLVTHPAVRIVQVVAAPDRRYVEVPAAFIEVESGHEVTEQDIIDFCRGKIATFRVPRYVRFVTEWPVSGTKIKKFELRETIAQELKQAGTTEAPKVSSA